jgi:hypothetical protein
VTPAPTTPTVAQASASDRAALVALYHATGGPDWKNNHNWLNAPIDEWHGVWIDEAGRVTGLELQSNNLIGEIPEELSKLTKLERVG